MDISRLEEVSVNAWRIAPTGAMRVPAVIYADRVLVSEMDDNELGVELARRGIVISTRELRTLDLPGLRAAAPERPAGIVLSSTSALCDEPGIPELVERFGCAVLVVSP